MITKGPKETKKKHKYIKANETVRKRRAELIAHRKGKCKDCRLEFSDWMFDFHHLNPEDKKFALSGKGLTRKWTDVLLEFDKCILLCPNCHRKRHYHMSQQAGKEY